MNSHTSNSRRLNVTGCVHKSDQEIFGSVLKHWGKKLGYCSIVAAVPAVIAANLPVSRTVEAKKPEAPVIGKERRNPAKLDLGLNKRALLKRQSTFLLPHQGSGVGLPVSDLDDCPGRVIPGGDYPVAAPYIDSGDTTGANNTINGAYFYGAGYQTIGSFGPDHVYSFTLTGVGPQAQIQISTSSANYRRLIYILQGGFRDACIGDQTGFSWYGLTFADSANGVATINSQTLKWMPLNVPLYLFVDSRTNDPGSGPYTIKIQDVTIVPTASPNIIDGPEFFVYQHYQDFLGRVPDPEGIAFWTNEITSCGSDPACIETRRINDSGAFFLSIEFQETGYLLYRMHLASFGNLPNAPVPITIHDFWSDSWELRSGVVVNEAGCQTTLERNKRTFFSHFVQRPRFTNAFPAAMSAQEFVDKLNANAGNLLSKTVRDQLVSNLSGGGLSRADVLRVIAENPGLVKAELNRAFVLMQYFGYLRRNPNDAPDGNFVGYNSWLDKLNMFNGDFVQAEMVKAFISSTEYRQRFGP